MNHLHKVTTLCALTLALCLTLTACGGGGSGYDATSDAWGFGGGSGWGEVVLSSGVGVECRDGQVALWRGL